eukprot:4766330-Amphidinium_carterae.2
MVSCHVLAVECGSTNHAIGPHKVVHLDVPFELRAERSLAVYGPFGADALAKVVAQFEKNS